MYVFVDPTFVEPVTVHTPDPAAPGAARTETFTMVFKPLSKPAIEAFEAASKAAQTGAAARDAEIDALAAAAVRWGDDVVDADRAPVPFDADAFRRFAFHPWNRKALWQAYFTGMERERAGN